MGQPSDLIVPYPEYLPLGADAENRQLGYRCLFASRLSQQVITEILDATNTAEASLRTFKVMKKHES
jgi:hypothetical protein